MSLNGHTAVVTGGGRGLGRAIASVLAARGAAVAVWDLRADGAQETVDQINASGGRAVAIVGDAADADAVASAAQASRDEVGAVDILVNNAGITNYIPFTEMSPHDWDGMMRVNLRGPFLVTREFVPDMVAKGWGRVVNISSSSAQTGAPAMAHYAASKGGVIGFTKALAMELASTGVTVNNVPPGFVDTPLLREGIDVQAVAATMPMKRAGVPADIAHAVAYLASEEAAYVTGQTLSVNGGRYLV